MKKIVCFVLMTALMISGLAFAQSRGFVYGDSGDSYIRTAPGLEADKTGKVLKKDACADFTGETVSDDRGMTWYSVEYEGSTGWVSSRYTRLELTEDTGSGAEKLNKDTQTDSSQQLSKDRSLSEYSAYLDLLVENESAIRCYRLNDTLVATDAGAVHNPRSIIFADLFCDGTPELIFPTADEEGNSATLHIYTLRDGTAVELSTCENWNSRENGVSVACLYQVNGSDDLYGAIDGSLTGFYHWYGVDGETLVNESLLRNWDETSPAAWINGERTELSVYMDGVNAFPQNAQNILFYECVEDGEQTIDSRDIVSAVSLPGNSMTFEEAVEYIREGCRQTDCSDL